MCQRLEIEELILNALADARGAKCGGISSSDTESRRDLLNQLVTSVSIHTDIIKIKLTTEAATTLNRPEIVIPWQRKNHRPKRHILLPHTDPSKDGRPIRPEVRTSVVQAVAMGRAWLQQLVSGEAKDTEVIAQREDRSKRSVHMMVSLAFVAPDIIEALISGRLPRGIGITRLADLPLDWAKQRQVLGVSNRSLTKSDSCLCL